MLDWMHIFFIGGCFNLEAWAVLRALFAADLVTRITYKTLATAMTQWITPKSEPDISLLFTKQHHESCKDANMFKCQASEGLSVAPLLAKFVEDFAPDGVANAEIDSYLDMVDVIDLLNECKEGRPCSPELLETAISKWLRAHQLVYGETLWKPKHHLVQKLIQLLRDWEYLPACWTQDMQICLLERVGKIIVFGAYVAPQFGAVDTFF